MFPGYMEDPGDWRGEESHSRVSDNGCLGITGGEAGTVRTEDT